MFYSFDKISLIHVFVGIKHKIRKLAISMFQQFPIRHKKKTIGIKIITYNHFVINFICGY